MGGEMTREELEAMQINPNEFQQKNRVNWPKLDPPADGLQAQIDALRAAVVARNGLLEALSEQIRLGFEKCEKYDFLIPDLKHILEAFVVRLDALEKQEIARREWLENELAGRDKLFIRLAAIEAKLPAQKLTHRMVVEQNKALTGKQRRSKKR